jgi:hypothetical protein
LEVILSPDYRDDLATSPLKRKVLYVISYRREGNGVWLTAADENGNSTGERPMRRFLRANHIPEEALHEIRGQKVFPNSRNPPFAFHGVPSSPVIVTYDNVLHRNTTTRMVSLGNGAQDVPVRNLVLVTSLGLDDFEGMPAVANAGLPPVAAAAAFFARFVKPAAEPSGFEI